ncbi:4Fe-4S binding protein, partial [Planctomycetota bacterium]
MDTCTDCGTCEEKCPN